MKKNFVKVLAMVSILSFATVGCTTTVTNEAKTNESKSETKEMVGLANPFVEYATLEEAEQAVGFDITLPSETESYEKVIYRVETKGKMLEIIYKYDDKTKEKEAYRIRKKAGNENISGDYTKYQFGYTMELGDINYAFHGKKDKIFLVVWRNDGYTYSLNIDFDGKGMSKEDAEKIVQEIK